MHGQDAGGGEEEYGRRSSLALMVGGGWVVKPARSWEYCTSPLAHSRCLYRWQCSVGQLAATLQPQQPWGQGQRGRQPG